MKKAKEITLDHLSNHDNVKGYFLNAWVQSLANLLFISLSMQSARSKLLKFFDCHNIFFASPQTSR